MFINKIYLLHRPEAPQGRINPLELTGRPISCGAPALRGGVPDRGDCRHAGRSGNDGAHPAPPGENETERSVGRYGR